MDSNLTVGNHMNECVKVAFRLMFMICKLRRSLSTRTTSMLYKQLVHPHLECFDFLEDSCLMKHTVMCINLIVSKREF